MCWVTGSSQRDLAFIHQHGERGGGERLGVGRDAEQRLRGDRRRLALLAHAVAFGQHDVAVLDDGHRDAGDVEFLAGALHYLIDIILCGAQRRREQHRGGQAKAIQHGIVSVTSPFNI